MMDMITFYAKLRHKERKFFFTFFRNEFFLHFSGMTCVVRDISFFNLTIAHPSLLYSATIILVFCYLDESNIVFKTGASSLALPSKFKLL